MTKKSIFSLLILVILGTLSIWAFLFSKSLMGNVHISEEESVGDEQVTIKELVITETRNGQKFWEIYAETGYYDNGNNIAVLKNIAGNFYKEDNVILSVISPEATFNNKNKEIKLHGGAQAANDKGVFIRADEICWAGSKDEVTAKGNVKIIKEEGLMTVSDKSSFDTDFSNLKLTGNVNAYVFESIYGNLEK
ncbi:MAG: LPS export ABC transporter periplasmic protein LptC [Candidatus Melainabacteria bacterium GWF2_32_7]|nr:MAG: LPS export ABC transporter periplasmic protein LptC [Candidatus Melainabacteria bacterium GWF2_32_7]